MESTAHVTPTSPEEKQPGVIRIIKSILDIILVPVLAVFSALIIAGLIIVVTDSSVYTAFQEQGIGGGLARAWRVVITAYGALFSGSLGSADAISESLVSSTPFIFAGLAVALGFRGGLFNIGAEGQLWVAAGVSVVIGYSFQLPAIIHLPFAIIGGFLGGAIYGAIPGYLKARTGAHEVINTIMMNFIAFRFFDWAFTGPLRRPGGDAPVTAEILRSAYLPRLFDQYRFHWGFFMALLVAFAVWWLLFKTTLGFEIRTVGANPNAARYGGIKITRITVLTMAISGGLAGLAGTNEVLGVNHFLAGGFSSGYGFDAIALALLGKSHPLGVVLAALLFGTLRSGATRMQSVASIPIDIISIMQALVIVFIAAPAIIRWIYRVRVEADLDSTTFTRGWGA